MPRSEDHDQLTDWTAIGHAIYQRRIEIGMERQQDLAEQAGVHLNTIGRIERGVSSTRRNPTWPKIEAALGWPIGYIASLADGEPRSVSFPMAENLAEQIRKAVLEAVAVVEPDVTVRQAREIAEATIVELRRQELLPPASV